MSYLPIGKDTGDHNVQGNPDMELREQDRWLPIANVARLMKNTLPATSKVSKDAKECMQECVSEFISFITSEASDKCLREKRKTINGEDILYSMHDLGFENYAEVLKIYLAKYREQQALKQERGETRASKKLAKKLRNHDAGDNADLNEPEDDYIKNEPLGLASLDESQRLDQLAYSASPQGKDVQSPDYFHQYDANDAEGNPSIAHGEDHISDQHLDDQHINDQHINDQHIKHDLDVHSLDGGIDAKEGYRYGDFLNEDNDHLKENGKNGHHMNDLAKLTGDDADMDNLGSGITNRSYY